MEHQLPSMLQLWTFFVSLLTTARSPSLSRTWRSLLMKSSVTSLIGPTRRFASEWLTSFLPNSVLYLDHSLPCLQQPTEQPSVSKDILVNVTVSEQNVLLHQIIQLGHFNKKLRYRRKTALRQLKAGQLLQSWTKNHIWKACTLFDIARYWSKIASFYLLHLYLALPLWVTPLEFRQDVWHQNTWVFGLSYGVVCVILRLAIFCRTPTYDRRTDGRFGVSSLCTLYIHCVSKNNTLDFWS